MKLAPLFKLSASFCICALSLTAAAERPPVASSSKPNFLIILADDLGYGDLGFTGNDIVQTPNLDRLANDGVIFKNGYVTHPYCGPSRAGLITGRYQARFGLEINLTYSPFDLYQGLPLDEKTFAERLKPAGYRNGIIGKWHLGGSEPFHPNSRGFDYFYGFLAGSHDYFPGGTNTHKPLLLPNGQPHSAANQGTFLPLTRNTKDAEFDEYLTTALSRDAAKFVKQSDKPFCLYLAYNAPHGPLQAPQEYIDKYSHVANEERRIYLAMIDAMDEGVGMVVEALKESGKFENTLIFFLSDNGGVQSKPGYEGESWADNGPFRNGKGSMREGGNHVPFILHWPAGLPKGMSYDLPVSSLDMAATAVALGQGDLSGKPLDGVNLIPYLTGQQTGAPHEAIYWRKDDGQSWAVRTPSAKYLLEGPQSTPELYDMVNDPYESNNLINDSPEQRQKLAKLWNDWNANNQANVFLQSSAYERKRIQLYEQLFKELQAGAAKRQPLVIE